MDTQEILKRVRRIEIKTRGLSANVFAGSYHSAFKGRGMAFSEVREYQYGDDVRDIDWNVTERFHRPYVKVFEEEREVTLMLLVDVSGSLNFGTRGQLQRDMVTEIAATLAFSAIQNNDKVGMVFFSDRIEKYIPPKKGRKHILHLIREMLDFQPSSTRTDLSVALQFLMQVMKRRCSAFVLSDFVIPESNYTHPVIQMAGRRHDLMAIQVYDRWLAQLPEVGLVKVVDAETGYEQYVDTGSSKLRRLYSRHWQESQSRLSEVMSKSRISKVSVSTEGDFVRALKEMFTLRQTKYVS